MGVPRKARKMADQTEYGTDEAPVQACLGNQVGAWAAFFDRFDETLSASTRRALGRQAGNAELLERLVEDLRAELFLEQNVLRDFAVGRGRSFTEYLAGVARQRVKRHFQALSRTREVKLTRDVPEQSPLTSLDQARLQELIARLPPKPAEYLETLVFGPEKSNSRRRPATSRERQWVFRIRKQLKEMEREG